MLNRRSKMLIAGPCALESEAQAFRIARFVKKCGATAFRGGCFKGQNRPIVNGKPEYTGIGEDGLYILERIQDQLGLPCVCDAQSIHQAELIKGIHGIHYLMIGARNMDNLCLLREVRRLYDTKGFTEPIILKRGPSATIDEWVGAAEHLGGPSRVILCERGIVTFDRTSTTRWRLDLVGAAHIKTHTDYRLIIDPSHGSGDRSLVELLARCSIPLADGLMIEVHYDPDSSPTDSGQTIDFKTFKRIARLYSEDKSWTFNFK